MQPLVTGLTTQALQEPWVPLPQKLLATQEFTPLNPVPNMDPGGEALTHSV
jgi:hypothetical protein